jgi:hypothetical protein
MHQAALARRNSAGWTRGGGKLFSRQVAHPHQEKVPKNKPKYRSKMAQFQNQDSKTVDSASELRTAPGQTLEKR